MNKKSQLASFLLTFFLGPLGLLYSSVAGGIILFIIALVSWPTFVGPVLCWILAIVVGAFCTAKHNAGVDEFKAMVMNNNRPAAE